MASSPDQTASSRFDNKTVLITGASDRGIGGGIAERMGKEGASLAMLSRSEPKRLLKLLARRDVDARWITCDITSPERVEEAVAEIVAWRGTIDVLINNAGVEEAAEFASFDRQQWRQILNVNLFGSIEVTQTALPHLGDPAVVINVSSALGMGGCPGFSVYSASKAALDGFTRSLAWELAPRRVRVVGVAPGLVHTPMIHKHLEHLTPAISQQIEDCHPLGMGSPHDVAGVVAFLASADASWVTGVTIPVGWAPHYPLPTLQFMGDDDK